MREVGPDKSGSGGPLSCLVIRFFDPFDQIFIDHFLVFNLDPVCTHCIPTSGSNDITGGWNSFYI